MPTQIKIDVICVFCGECYTIDETLPDGWDSNQVYITIDGTCPGHEGAGEFLGNQCAGCLMCWGDCRLYKTIFEGGNVDLDAIKAGRCPERINGTVDGKGSSIPWEGERASLAAGKAMANAIQEYREIMLARAFVEAKRVATGEVKGKDARQLLRELEENR